MNQKTLTLKEKSLNEKLNLQLTEAEQELTEQATSLKKLENRTLLEKITNFFIGLVVGGGITSIIYLTQFK